MMCSDPAYLNQNRAQFPPLFTVGEIMCSDSAYLNQNRAQTHSQKPVKIRSVWARNLASEFVLIQQAILTHPYISMDTEFPGIIPNSAPRSVSGQNRPYWKQPEELYKVMKVNVDKLNIIQVGLTLSDSCGNLPDFGSDMCYIWEFNFCDFDPSIDLYAPDSIQLLTQNGIDFERNRIEGVNSYHFGQLLLFYRLVCNPSVHWVTFHGTYDVAFFVKLLTRQELPKDMWEFLGKVSAFFGEKFWDIKYMIEQCDGLYGGLDRVAQALEVKRTAGTSHQAGSDSLLTWQVFLSLHQKFFTDGSERLAGKVHGFPKFGSSMWFAYHRCNIGK